MKLENQVSNKELSMEIEKLGVKQESLWYWVERWNPVKFIALENDWTLTSFLKICRRKSYSAFTVAELQLALMEYPQEIDHMHRLCDLTADYLARRLVFRIKKEGLVQP